MHKVKVYYNGFEDRRDFICKKIQLASSDGKLFMLTFTDNHVMYVSLHQNNAIDIEEIPDEN